METDSNKIIMTSTQFVMVTHSKIFIFAKYKHNYSEYGLANIVLLPIRTANIWRIC